MKVPQALLPVRFWPPPERQGVQASHKQNRKARVGCAPKTAIKVKALQPVVPNDLNNFKN
jgi:hypothetical protein